MVWPSTIGKSLLNSNMSSTCLRNMANFSSLTAEIGSNVWGSQQISTDFASCRRYCSDVAHRRPTKLCTMFGHLLGWYTDRLLPGAKFTLRPSLAFAYVGSVTARHSSCGRQRNFAALSRGRHLYSAGRLSRWASAHFLVLHLGLIWGGALTSLFVLNVPSK